MGSEMCIRDRRRFSVTTVRVGDICLACAHQEIHTRSQNEGEEAVDVVAVEAEAVGVAVEAEEGDDRVNSE